MKGYLLDTNVVSELRRRDRCNPGVRAWINGVPDEELHVSVLVFGEIRRGIERIRRREPARARELEDWLDQTAGQFPDRALPVDARVAEQWGRLGVRNPVPPVDGLMAATALAHDLVLVTRNIPDVAGTGAKVLDPFSPEI